MGKGKKKDKKKKKRQRSSSRSESSSDSDSYDDRDYSAGKYSSKSKNTYTVEDARPKQLQAIADNYSSKSERTKSKYDVDDDDTPETEEYVYDQFGQQIVEKSRDMSMSPTSSGDEYGHNNKSRSYKDMYEKEKKNKTSSSTTTIKGRQDTNSVKSQINVASSYERKRDVIDLVDDSGEYAKKKETKETIYVSDNYGERSSLHGGSQVYDSGSNNYSKYASSDPPPPPPPPPDSPPPDLPPPESDKYSRNADYEHYNKGNQGATHVEPKRTVSNYNYTSSDYPPQRNYDNSHEYYKDQKEYASSNYTSENVSNYNEPKNEMVDYNSAEFMVRKIREETKSKVTDKVNNSKYDHSSSIYLQNEELKVESDYTSYHTDSVVTGSSSSSLYNENRYHKEQASNTTYQDKYQTKEENVTSYNERTHQNEPSDYRTSEYNPQKQNLTDSTKYASSIYEEGELPSHPSNDAPRSGYIYDKDSSKQPNASFDYADNKPLQESSDIYSEYDTYKQGNYKPSDYNDERTAGKQFGNSDYNYKNDRESQRSYVSDTSNENNFSSNKDNYVSEYRDRNRQDDNVSSYYNKRDSKQSDIAPPGDDEYYTEENEKSSKYDNYYGSRPEKEDNQQKYNKQIEKIDKGRDSPPKRNVEDANNEPASSTSSNQESLSIGETNKLRAKLGLKPLNVDSGSSTKMEDKAYADRGDVHRPATNLADKKSEEKMREKMEAIREKRKINKKLKKVKGLGEEDDPVLDSAAAWVAKSRMDEKEKQLAEKRAQELDEMDEEFGVTKIMSKSILKKGSKYDEYSSKNLQGLKVEHKGSDLGEGETVILTLKDKDILDEDDEDVLHNINVQENEKAKENIKKKKKRPGYQAYDEIDEETGELKIRTVLDKYDEEIDGKKKDSFRLGDEGTADLEGENHITKVRAILKSQQISLAADEPQLARDYLNPEEMTKFKRVGKKKKVRKIRKREVLKADDLLKMTDVDSYKDRGSRKPKSALKNSGRDEEDTSMDMDIAPTEPDELDYFVAVHQHMQEEEPLFKDDEAEQELEIALQRSRRVKQKTGQHIGGEDATIEKVAKQVLSKEQVKGEAENVRNRLKKKNKNAIILDSTSEFCRTLGDVPTLSAKQQPEEEEKLDDDMDIEEPESTANAVNGWEQVEIAGESKIEDEKDDDDDVLEAEPIPTGLAATLNLANMKGYLKDGKEKVRKFDPLNLPETKAEVDIEKLRDEEKNKYTRGYDRDRDRDRYDPYAWKEKTNYKPDVKLEYVDSKGRQMNQKEAFRLLSHKFHGKGSGKLKTEKRSKKLMDQKKLQMMSSIDTPLNTSALFKDKQKQSQSAYLVLSGGGKNILSGETLKK